jgi:hypothetical protein
MGHFHYSVNTLSAYLFGTVFRVLDIALSLAMVVAMALKPTQSCS